MLWGYVLLINKEALVIVGGKKTEALNKSFKKKGLFYLTRIWNSPLIRE